ncbi:MAG TPA: acyl-homoserine-lactone synthase [Ktedonobacterales bacterium]|nr:acyl-homoserine-lactone synthase [Ktedonobacterales bacterium]
MMAVRQLDDLAELPMRPEPLPIRPTYVARQLRRGEAAAFDAALRLRQTVFAQELAWVPASADGRERDRCDAAARHFAVFDRASLADDERPAARLVAYARVLLPADGLMLEREFATLLGGRACAADPGRAFEVSRLVVDARWRGRLGEDRRGAVEHLGRAIAWWALARGRTEWLSVCELRHVRALRLRGLPFQRFGRVVEYQAGVPVCAARLDLPRAAARLRRLRPADYAWYAEGMEP